MKKLFAEVLKVTFPILIGFLFIGMAFGVFLHNMGYGFLWAALMSGSIYTGAMQFMATTFFSGAFSWTQIILLSFVMNVRHLFYGISFIETFNQMGKKKWYMIFALADETYSLLCYVKPPEGVDKNKFYFYIALINHLYFIIGAVFGSLVGQFIPFSTRGIEFSMTALFIVIFVEQWKTYPSKVPAIMGVVFSVISLIIFGATNFILPAMIIIIVGLIIYRKYSKETESKDENSTNTSGEGLAQQMKV